MAEHTGSNKNTAIAFLEMASNGKVAEAFQRFVSQSFRHHNPSFKGDAAGLAAGLTKVNAEHPGKVFEVKHALEDRDFVAVHSRIRLDPSGPDMSVIHLFRFVAIRIVEMWDISQLAPQHAVNEVGLF